MSKKNLELEELSKLYKLLNKKFSKKINIQTFLEKNSYLNKDDIINISYDIQSGSTIKNYNISKKKQSNIFDSFIKILNENFSQYKTILDFGCGELTTSFYIFKKISKKISKFYANDVSLNRLVVGQKFLKKKLNLKNYKKFEIFCSSYSKLPLLDGSIDVVITNHSIEPNNKYKYEIIEELLRISKYGLCLLEPNYELASIKQKKRMDKFGYVKNLSKVFKKHNCSVSIIASSTNSNAPSGATKQQRSCFNNLYRSIETN